MTTHSISQSTPHTNRQTLLICFLAALAGLLFGLDMGVIAGALPFLAKEFALSSHQQEMVVSIMMLGAALGALCSGPLCTRIGRKKTLLIGSVLFVVGSIGCALAPDLSTLVISRFLLGAAVGVASLLPHFTYLKSHQNTSAAA